MADRTTRIGMPVDKFIEQSNDQPFEIINREKRVKVPASFDNSMLIRLLFMMLENHAQAKKSGEVYSNTPFVLTEEDDRDWVIGARIPDVMFFSSHKMATYAMETPNHHTRPLSLVPDLVIEVASLNGADLDEKIDTYLRDGVRIVWILNPQSRQASVHKPGNGTPVHIQPDEVLYGEDIMPGFKIALAKLFD